MINAYTLVFVALNQPILIGRFMLIFSRRRIDVTDFGFRKISEQQGEFFVSFTSSEWMAQNLQKQINKLIDVYSVTLQSNTVNN
jgi:acetolactate synthase regulatory subunit